MLIGGAIGGAVLILFSVVLGGSLRAFFGGQRELSEESTGQSRDWLRTAYLQWRSTHSAIHTFVSCGASQKKPCDCPGRTLSSACGTRAFIA